ncbi:uncharacterized protein C8A04DRAFT_32864 [Dichotomopilus funicola]|uniref:Uncharacterized protein n=1 Tax=Dichotomopilus funicola TaxID=1934379 RepID=A0AAN6UUW6_9PEZI|nr:hypothetical protein C8A04DRAFT_32864 [Dichotomopilus funicola]
MALPNFSTLLTHLTTATTTAYPKHDVSPYSTVKVLLLTWDTSVAEPARDREARDLEALFRGVYCYETEYWTIPARRAAVEVSRKVAGVLDGCGKGDLVVVYYGGWAKGGVWAASPNRDAPTVSSSILHSFLAETDCDVLLLQDCPTLESNPNPDTPSTSTGGIIECLSAGSLDAPTPQTSFTASLAQSLAHAAYTADWLTGVELHRQVFVRLQQANPNPHSSTLSLANDAYSLVQLDHAGQPLEEARQGSSVPVYKVLGERARTVVLMPLSQGPTDTPRIQLTPPSPQPPTTSTTSETGPDVLATCRLVDTHVDVHAWRAWLNSPVSHGEKTQENRKRIQVSALFPSPHGGAVLLLRLPLAVWDMLGPQHTPVGALSFVGYVTGEDHISVWRRALGGEVESESESESELDSELASDTEAGSEKGARNATRTGGKSTLWPKSFSSPAHARETVPYCLALAEMQGDTETETKAARVMRAFAQDRNPAVRYVWDEMEAFCGDVGFEDLQGDEVVAIVGGDVVGEGGLKFLTRRGLYDTLEPTAPLIDIETKDTPTNRRVYIPHLDAPSSLILAATATESQVNPLQDTIYKHLTRQASIAVDLDPTQTFHLSLHLPFPTLRSASSPDPRGLRSSVPVPFPATGHSEVQTQKHLHEAHLAHSLIGHTNRAWTAYSFLDTYYDDVSPNSTGSDSTDKGNTAANQSRHAVAAYQATQGGVERDPVTFGRSLVGDQSEDARDYFLKVLQAGVEEVKGEWMNAGRGVLRGLKIQARKRGLNHSPETLQVLEHLIHCLADTLSAWAAFKEHDLGYFDLDNEVHQARIRAVDGHMRELAALRAELENQSRLLRTTTPPTSPSTPSPSPAPTSLTTPLTVTLLTLLPILLTLTLLASLLPSPPTLSFHTPSPFTMQTTPHSGTAHSGTAHSGNTHPGNAHVILSWTTIIHYLLVSSVMTCLIAAVCMITSNWSAVANSVWARVGGGCHRGRGRFLAGRMSGVPGFGKAVAGLAGVGGFSRWEKVRGGFVSGLGLKSGWWAGKKEKWGNGEAGKGYEVVRDETEEERAEGGRGLPF